MDVKSKGFRWVESMCQTFETVCEDVDSGMSQAPVKYVGNPVHIVGKGVKKFCSSVMLDLLSPANSGKDGVLEASPEDSDYIEGFIDSLNLEDNEFYMTGEQTVELHGAASRVNQETVTSVLLSSPAERQRSDSSKTDALSQVDVSCRSTITDLTSSRTAEKPHSDPDHEYEHIKTPCDGSDRNSSPNSLFQMNVPYLSSFTSSHMVKKPQFEPYDEYEHIETPCDGSDRSAPLESANGEFALPTNVSEEALPNPTKPQSMAFMDNPTNAVVSKPVSGFDQNESSQKANYSEGFAISSNSYDVDPFRISESETLSCSSGSNAEQGWGSSTLESSMMFSDICISDDLSDSDHLAESFSVDDSKLLQPDLVTDRHLHFPSSHRRPSLKSYKKLLQDTLNSKKRLVKEYKQLGIWHGDIYDEHESVDSTRSTKPSSQPATQSISTDVATCNQNLSEWELL